MKINVGTVEILKEDSNRDLVANFLATAPQATPPKLLPFPFLSLEDPGFARFKNWLFDRRPILAGSLEFSKQIEDLIYAWSGILAGSFIVSEGLAPDARSYVMDHAKKTIRPNQEDFWLLTSPVASVAHQILFLNIVLDEMTSERAGWTLLKHIGGEVRVLELIERFRTDLNYRSDTISAFYQATRYHFWVQKIIIGGVTILAAVKDKTGAEWYEHLIQSDSYVDLADSPQQKQLMHVFLNLPQATDSLDQIHKQWLEFISKKMLRNGASERLSVPLNLVANDGDKSHWQSGLNFHLATLADKWTNMRMNARLDWVNHGWQNVHQRVQDLWRNETSSARGEWHVNVSQMVYLDDVTDRNSGEESDLLTITYRNLEVPAKEDLDDLDEEKILLAMELDKSRFEVILDRTSTEVLQILCENGGQIANKEIATQIQRCSSSIEKSRRKMRTKKDQILSVTREILKIA